MVINYLSQSPADLRRRHRAIALTDVQASPGISRTELARRLGLSDMAATRIVRDLLEAKVLREMPAPKEKVAKERSVGRPKIGLTMRDHGVFGVGMTFSAYHSEVSVSNGNGEVIGRRKVKDIPFNEPLECARLFSQELEELISELGIVRARICGVGVVLSAKVDPQTGAILHSDYFGWKEDGGAFSDCVREVLKLPVTIRNIADAIAVSEIQYGVARGVNNLVLVHTASLTGASIISNGEVLLGHDGFAGRVGHIAHEVKDFSCVCGRNDCLNLSSSGFAILKNLGLTKDDQFQAAHIEQYAKMLRQVAQSGNEAAIENAGRSIAPLLDTMKTILNPELFVLSGTIGSNENFVSGAQEAFFCYRPKEYSPETDVVSGLITAVEAAPMLALSDLCFSDLFDFESFLETAHLVEDAMV